MALSPGLRSSFSCVTQGTAGGRPFSYQLVGHWGAGRGELLVAAGHRVGGLALCSQLGWASLGADPPVSPSGSRPGLAFPCDVVGRRSSKAQSQHEPAGDPSAAAGWFRHVLGAVGLCGREGGPSCQAAPGGASTGRAG